MNRTKGGYLPKGDPEKINTARERLEQADKERLERMALKAYNAYWSSNHTSFEASTNAEVKERWLKVARELEKM